MSAKSHWEAVYSTKAPDAVSWYRPHLDLSLSFIKRAAPSESSSIIDVGGGEATLVDDLLQNGYRQITVLDISHTALVVSKQRLGPAAPHVRWISADVTKLPLRRHSIDIWHDRAVFHFLTDPTDRQRYVQSVLYSVRPGGTVIVSAFGPEGPAKCSGLEVARYDAQELHEQFGASFRLVESSQELHFTPWGSPQQFVYCYCKVEIAGQ